MRIFRYSIDEQDARDACANTLKRYDRAGSIGAVDESRPCPTTFASPGVLGVGPETSECSDGIRVPEGYRPFDDREAFCRPVLRRCGLLFPVARRELDVEVESPIREHRSLRTSLLLEPDDPQSSQF